jgi:hypothetical protein
MATATLSPLTASVNGTHTHAPADEPAAVLTAITPEMARDWLASAHPNRPISRRRVQTIARAIAAGLWQVNGQTIVLCPEFRLLDGRHRLSAIVEAGRTVHSLVVCGIAPACFLTMDQGAKRSGAHVLAMSGHPHAQTLCSALRWLWRFANQRMTSASIELLDYQLPDYLAQHPSFVSALTWGLAIKALVPPGCGAMLYHVMRTSDPALAKKFFLDLSQGLELKASDAPYLIREKFFHEKTELHHMGVCTRAAVLVQGWHCLRKDLPMSQAKLRWSGDSAAFPVVC